MKSFWKNAVHINCLAALAGIFSILVSASSYAVIDDSNVYNSNCYLVISSDGQVSYRCDVITVTAPRDPPPSPSPPTFTPLPNLPGSRGLTLYGKPIGRCQANARSQAYYKCVGRTGGLLVPPAYPIDLPIDNNFVTRAAWRPAILDFLNTVYKSDDPYAWKGWDSALYASMQRCTGDTGCMAEVWLYFGQTNIALPNLGAFGDVNWLANLLTLPISRPSYETSPAAALITRVTNVQVCNALKTASERDGCTP